MSIKDEISTWFDEGIKLGAHHMIIVCDEFDYGDYPAYVFGSETAHDHSRHFTYQNMQRVMEVYDLRKNKQEQLDQRRCFNWD